MKLYFVRHGRASQEAMTDAARPLTEDGATHVRHLAKVLARMDVAPKKIFSSPRVRARQTAEIIAEAVGSKVIIHEHCDFSFNLNRAFDLVKGMADNAEVMFVGHNFSMSEVVTQACGAEVELNVGAIACVTRIYPPHTQGAVLRWLLNPKVILGISDYEE